MPECDVILAELTAYLARAPKSVAVYEAYGRVKQDIAAEPNDPVPIHLRNGATKLMKELGYGKDYVYTPHAPQAKQEFLPERLRGRKYLKAT
jgi:putative ATPase